MDSGFKTLSWRCSHSHPGSIMNSALDGPVLIVAAVWSRFPTMCLFIIAAKTGSAILKSYD